MINKLLESFSAATWSVLQMMLDVGPKEEGVTASTPLAEDGVSVRIGLSGQTTGQAVFYFPRATALQVVEIMGGIQIEDIDDFVTSAVGELSNIISGNAATMMAENAVVCNIRPPEIAVGAPPPFDAQESSSAMLSTTAGSVGLVIALG